MLLLLKGLLFTRTGLIAVGIMAALVWRAADVHHQRQIGASRAVEKIEEKNNANVRKAEAARQSVRSIPVDRLRDAYRRD